jgi:glycosyltransferase involved in cell wall biosynthesis
LPKLKIAFVHHNKLSYMGGGEKFELRLAKFLSSRGHNVTMYSLPIVQDSKGASVVPKNLGITYREGILQRIDADVVYVFYAPAYHRLFRYDSPSIAGIHSQLLFYKWPPTFNIGLIPFLAVIINRLNKMNLHNFAAVHLNSFAQVSTGLVNYRCLYVIPNAFDENVFKPYQNKPQYFKLIFAGRHTFEKGWDIFLAIRRSLPSYMRTDFAGGSSFISSEYALAKFYSGSHVAVLPNRFDTFGNTIVESCLCGTPVITSPIDAHKSLSMPLYYASNVSEFRSSIDVLYRMWSTDFPAYEAYCKSVRESALQYSMSKIGPRYEKMFLEVATAKY